MRFDVLKSLLVAAALLVSGSAFAQTLLCEWQGNCPPAPVPTPTPTPNSLGLLNGTLYAYKFTAPVNCPKGPDGNTQVPVPGIVSGDIVLWAIAPVVQVIGSVQGGYLPAIQTNNNIVEIAWCMPSTAPGYVPQNWQVIVLRPTAPIAPGW
jgi:hypothetical protein